MRYKQYTSVGQRSYEAQLSNYLQEFIQGAHQSKGVKPKKEKQLPWDKYWQESEWSRGNYCLGKDIVPGCSNGRIDTREVFIQPYGKLWSSGVPTRLWMNSDKAKFPLCQNCNLLWYNTEYGWTVKDRWVHGAMENLHLHISRVRAMYPEAEVKLRQAISPRLQEFQSWWSELESHRMILERLRYDDLWDRPEGHTVTWIDFSRIKSDGWFHVIFFPLDVR